MIRLEEIILIPYLSICKVSGVERYIHPFIWLRERFFLELRMSSKGGFFLRLNIGAASISVWIAISSSYLVYSFSSLPLYWFISSDFLYVWFSFERRDMDHSHCFFLSLVPRLLYRKHVVDSHCMPALRHCCASVAI
jgi:hypothetical protein